MIESIIEILKAKLEYLKLFEKIYPLAVQKEIDGNTVIASYKGNGQYDYVTKIDNFNGLAYFRQMEDVDISPSSLDVDTGCDNLLAVRYPLRLVASIRMDQLPEDCAFSEDALCYLIISELTERSKELKTSLNAAKVNVDATKISTNRRTILSNELPSSEVKDINYNYALISIDFNIAIDIKRSCLVLPCATYGQN